MIIRVIIIIIIIVVVVASHKLVDDYPSFGRAYWPHKT
jgi:hypothetical protein